MKTPLTIALSAIAVLVTANLSTATADHPDRLTVDTICVQAEELACAAGDMKDEIKTHLCGAKGHAKMLGINALVRVKANAIQRRVKRNRCYRRLEKDVSRLDELVCQLQEQFEEVLACSSPRRPVYGELGHVRAKLDSMRYMSLCLKAEACRRLDRPVPVSVQRLLYQPSIAPYDMAPGEPVLVEPHLVPEVQPVLPQRSLKSVLEGGDPLIAPPLNGNRGR